ncbi:MAG TPA: SpoIIE family protein phosphatase [Treponemataceae bacterium]|nr:SpoIIE family protein phosphatase [Treponemataceae bacterium]
MSFLNDLAYIPLTITIIVVFLFLILSIVAKKKHPQYVSISLLFASFFAIAGLVLTIVQPNLSILTMTLLLQNLLLIPAICKIIRLKQDNHEEVIEVVDNTDTFTSELKETTDFLEEDEENTLYESCNAIMNNATKAFSDSDGLEKILDYVNSVLQKETNADGCAILTLDDFDDVLNVKSYKGDFPPPYKIPENIPHKPIRVQTNFKHAVFPLEGNIFAYIVKNGEPELIKDSQTDDRIYKNGTEDFLKTGSYIFVPMKVVDTIVGVVALSRKYGNDIFTEKELEKAQILSKFTSVALKNFYSFSSRLEHREITKESEIALNLQKNLIPKKLPVIPNVSLGKYFNPVEGICGDYFDILPSRKDRISFLIADVAGKGMNSLIVMVMIRAILRLIVNTTKSAGTILEWANRGVASESNIDHYAGVALVNYDTTTQEIQFATAGTTPIIHYAAEDKFCRKISKDSEPMGVEKFNTYEDIKLSLQSGDIIILFTDGVVEAVNKEGKQYSETRICDIIEKNATSNGKKITSAIKADLKKFCGEEPQHDDQTILVIKIQ